MEQNLSTLFLDLVRSAIRTEFQAFLAEAQGLKKPETPRFYDYAEACAIAKVSRPTLFRLEKKGLIRFDRIGNKKLISEESLLAAISAGNLRKYSRVE